MNIIVNNNDENIVTNIDKYEVLSENNIIPLKETIYYKISKPETNVTYNFECDGSSWLCMFSRFN